MRNVFIQTNGTSMLRKFSAKTLEKDQKGTSQKLMKSQYPIMIFFVRDFHARRFPLAESKWVLMTAEALCFLMSQGL